MEERSVKKLMTSVRCTGCGQYYQVRNVSILGHQNDMWFFRVFCDTCQSNFLITATVSGDASITSDLTPRELVRFNNARPLTADDFLDMHNFLSGFDGDFNRLFKFEKV